MNTFFKVTSAVICALSVQVSSADTAILSRSDAPTEGVQALMDAHQMGLNSSVAPQENYYGSCFIGNTGQRDPLGRYCATGYPIFYDGYIADNACYSQIQEAQYRMQNLRVCQLPTPFRIGGCELLQPNRRDYASRYCDRSYGFSYNGYIVNNMCDHQIDSALARMERTQVCRQGDHMGRCRIANPGERDIRGRYCNATYGVLFQGQIVNDSCYQDIDVALRTMQSYNFCF